MGRVGDTWIRELHDAILATQTPCALLTAAEAAAIRLGLGASFGVIGRTMWDNMLLPGSVGMADARGWSLMCDYVGVQEVILLINESQLPHTSDPMWVFACGEDVKRVLHETSSVEVALVDRALTFLLTFSHEDVLVGAGACVPWLRSHGATPRL